MEILENLKMFPVLLMIFHMEFCLPVLKFYLYLDSIWDE